MAKLYKLSPAFKEYIWGGKRLKTEWNKITDTETVAETWELSFHKDGKSRIAEAVFSGESSELNSAIYGKTVDEIVPKSEYGSNCMRFEFFPVLVKLIDAADNLSVQVHPGDEYALAREGQFGKTEMWYVADCEEGSGIYCGFSKEISRREFAELIRGGTLLSALNFFEVKKGDRYFIPSGTVHAIGKGVTICEIQQNSNLTYRVYDYDRRDKAGNARELHIEKAKDVSDLGIYRPYQSQTLGNGVRKLASCPYFTVLEYRNAGEAEFEVDQTSFASFTFVEGEGRVSVAPKSDPGACAGIAFRRGDTFFAPAEDARITVKGKCVFLLTKIE